MRTMLISAVVAASVAPFAAGAILNGSFESTALPSPDRVSINNATSWTPEGGFMLLERGVNLTSAIAAQDGDQFVSMGHNSASGDTLFQDFATTPGETLDVSFYVACIQGDAFQRITASVIDVSSGTILNSVLGDVSARSQGWVQYTMQFQPTGASTRIRFVHDLASGGANVALDNVVVTPAPGAAGMLALAGIAAARRRAR